MTSVLLVAKRNGVIAPCRSCPQPDGMVWQCGFCSVVCTRVSFGIINGLWRCNCGAEIELFIDDKLVNLQKLSLDDTAFGVSLEALTTRTEKPANVLEFPDRVTDKDKEFLEGCNIALDEEGDEPA